MYKKEMHLEKLSGVIERVTYHNEQNGWSVIKVTPFKDPARQVTVVIHQVQIFAGATMEFWGFWSHHTKYGEQFKAQKSIEKKPASTAALEKYLGSGLITGVGPQTAKKIVSHFKDQTLDVFENEIDQLMLVQGIAEKKLKKIKSSWNEHRSIRDVMIFLQGYGISTLFATKIFKTYGDKAIHTVSENPYRLAHDIYGIGFFSADKIALTMGFKKNSPIRIEAGIKHVLASSRDAGHCYLTKDQIVGNVLELLENNVEEEKITELLYDLLQNNSIKLRELNIKGEEEDKKKPVECFYSKSLYYDEYDTALKLNSLLNKKIKIDESRIEKWVKKYCSSQKITLSEEQHHAVCNIPKASFSVLTGGPGCGKTTCTNVLVKLLMAMGHKVTLSAPTGRAAQRMTEVMGAEAKTIHRLLEWAPHENGFKHNAENPIQTDFLILDEVSMLDISLACSLLKAVPDNAQVLFIGDPDQLPAVGAGAVLSDLLATESVPRFKLTKVFRQAKASSIIKYAYEINNGKVPKIKSPLTDPNLFSNGVDCLFVDADEATQDQLKFIKKVNQTVSYLHENESNQSLIKFKEEWTGVLHQNKNHEIEYDENTQFVSELKAPVLNIPDKYKNVDLLNLIRSDSELEQLKKVLKNVHPFSTLHHGLTAVDTLTRLYTKTIPEWLGRKTEIQVLTPQIRGSMGTLNLNRVLQNTTNPENPQKKQITIGDKTLREGDRVIQTRNNYSLGVFNGDIGFINSVSPVTLDCTVTFQDKEVVFKKEDLSELQLAYGITIHKSQGSEFEAVIIPVLGQHFNMLFRNLIYTGLTRAKKLAIFVGSRKALALAVSQIDNRKRQTALSLLLEPNSVDST